MSNDIRILGRIGSINVRKVLWAAAETDLPFVHEGEWGDQRDLRAPEFLALNPNGLVPVLVHEQGALWESNTICRYLAARAQRRDLLPDAPGPRAEVEQWMDWQATELNSAWRTAFMALVRRDPAFRDDPAAIERSARHWNGLMLLLEARIGQTGAFVTGETFTLADIALGLSLQRWLLTPISRPPTPALLAYRERVHSRPAARRLDPTIP